MGGVRSAVRSEGRARKWLHCSIGQQTLLQPAGGAKAVFKPHYLSASLPPIGAEVPESFLWSKVAVGD